MRLGKRDVNALFESEHDDSSDDEHMRRVQIPDNQTPPSSPSAHGWVKLPRHVRRAKHEDTVVGVSHPLHLHQELGLDAPRRVAFSLRSIRAQRVDFVDEDDRRFALAGHIEQVLHEPVRWRCCALDRRLLQIHECDAFTHFSLSPCHLDTRLDEDTAKNVASASVATACARYDLPVPGGFKQEHISAQAWTLGPTHIR